MLKKPPKTQSAERGGGKSEKKNPGRIPSTTYLTASQFWR